MDGPKGLCTRTQLSLSFILSIPFSAPAQAIFFLHNKEEGDQNAELTEAYSLKPSYLLIYFLVVKSCTANNSQLKGSSVITFYTLCSVIDDTEGITQESPMRAF